MIQVVLDGINNILKMAGEDVETIANMIEECGGKVTLSFSMEIMHFRIVNRTIILHLVMTGIIIDIFLNNE